MTVGKRRRDAEHIRRPLSGKSVGVEARAAKGTREASWIAPLTPQNTSELLTCLALAGCVFIIYAQVAGFSFINFDDELYVYDNPYVQAGLTATSLKWAWTTLSCGFYIPLTWLSFMAECQLFGANPGVHHLTNVILHALNSMLVFLLLRTMTGSLWRSAFVALLFAAHPLRVESVAWVAERKDVLSAFFAFLTMGAYVGYVRQPSKKRLSLVGLFLAMGLMAKPMLVTLPLLLLFVDYWPLRRLGLPTADSVPLRSRILPLLQEKLPLFALSAISGCLTFIAHYNQGVVQSSETFPLPVRLSNAVIAYVRYLKKAVWPRDLAVFYPYDHNPVLWQIAGAAILLTAITVLAVKAAKRLPYLISMWVWFLVGLAPVIGLIQPGGHALADRFTYVPLIGLLIPMVWGVADLLSKWEYRRIAVGTLAAAAFPPLMFCSWVQTGHWRDSISLFRHTISVTADNSLAHNNLGSALAARGDLDEAIFHYGEALRINPAYGLAHNGLGSALYKQRKPDEAIAHLREALRLAPRDDKAHNNLGVMLSEQGKLEEAIDHYLQALSANPYHAEAYTNLGNALHKAGRVDEAISAYQNALRIKPDYVTAHFNLGETLARKGDVENAIRHFARVVEINPADREARSRLQSLQQKQIK